MKSSFTFETYKVDVLVFEGKPIVGMLEFAGNIDPNLWKLSIAVREPLYSESQKKYVEGLDTSLCLFPPEVKTEDKNEALIKYDP